MPRQQPIARIYSLFDELSVWKTIPPSHQPKLKNSLVILFQRPPRKPSHPGRRGKEQLNAQFIHNKAARVYLDILDLDPHLFLAFILAISPRGCRDFDVQAFVKQHKHEKLRLTAAAKSVLQNIAQEANILTNSHFRKLMISLFPEGPYAVSFLLTFC